MSEMVIAFWSIFGRQYEGGGNWLEVTLLSLGMLAEPPVCLVLDAERESLPEALRDAPHVRPVPLKRTAEPLAKQLARRLVRRALRKPREDFALVDIARRYPVDLWAAFDWFEGLGEHRNLLICYPDFQFRHLPDQYDAHELRARESQWQTVARRAQAIVAISEATARDALVSNPEVAPRLHVCGFPPVFGPSTLDLDPDAVRRKYGLPGSFFLVSNQFWGHKNHRLVLRALEHLRDGGAQPPVVVFTGRPYDPRRPEAFSALLQLINERGLHERCRFLGVLPRAEQVALIRAAEAVVQPSRFEGRGAITEETCLLGGQLLCSDLPVHREHNLPGALFFGVDDAARLAELMSRKYPRPPKANAVILEESRRGALAYGERFMEVCRAAARAAA